MCKFLSRGVQKAHNILLEVRQTQIMLDDAIPEKTMKDLAA